jgi:hypothetical protein
MCRHIVKLLQASASPICNELTFTASPQTPNILSDSSLKHVEAALVSSESQPTSDEALAAASPGEGPGRTVRPRETVALAEPKKKRVTKEAGSVAPIVDSEMIPNIITGGVMVNPRHRNSVRLEHIWRPEMTLPSNTIVCILCPGMLCYLCNSCLGRRASQRPIGLPTT